MRASIKGLIWPSRRRQRSEIYVLVVNKKDKKYLWHGKSARLIFARIRYKSVLWVESEDLSASVFVAFFFYCELVRVASRFAVRLVCVMDWLLSKWTRY